MELIDRPYIERKCDQLVAAGFWPREQDLPFRAWLANFAAPADLSAAATILDRFVFINQSHASLAVSDGYARFLGYLHDHRFPASPRTSRRIQSLHEAVHFAPVRGEAPSPAESGNAYMRVAREILRVREDRIHELDEAISLCAQGHPLVLLDDFSGTANQIVNTLRTPDALGRTISRFLPNDDTIIACVTAVMTSAAIQRLRRQAPRLLLFPGYIAPEADYGLDALLPEPQFPDVHRLLRDCAPRLAPGRVDAVRGLNSLGLLLGIHDRIPDASLPILWAAGDADWTPLKLRQL